MRWVPAGWRSTRRGTPAPERSKSSSVRSIPRRPAMASRCTTALVDPPMAASATIALRKEPAVSTVLGRRSASTSSTASRPVAWACSSRRLSGAGVPAMPGQRHAERLGDAGHRGRGPHRVAVAAAADHRGLGPQEVVLGQRSGPHLLAEPPHVGAAAERCTTERPGEHRARRGRPRPAGRRTPQP